MLWSYYTAIHEFAVQSKQMPNVVSMMFKFVKWMASWLAADNPFYTKLYISDPSAVSDLKFVTVACKLKYTIYLAKLNHVTYVFCGYTS